MQLCGSLSILWHCLSLGLEWKLTFSSPVATAEFSKLCWHIECNTFTASFLRIWNSSTGIPSPPLALFIVMLSKAHLTSHSRVSGSRWVITPSWVSGSWRSFLYSSSSDPQISSSVHVTMLFTKLEEKHCEKEIERNSPSWLSQLEALTVYCDSDKKNFSLFLWKWGD